MFVLISLTVGHMVSFSVSKICHQTSESFGKSKAKSLWSNSSFCIPSHIHPPSISFCRYFFAEVFDFSRNYLLIVFQIYIFLSMLLPLARRFKHRPCFIAFVYLAFSSILKSYPSVNILTSL